ncbi:MAG: hypothetical protein ACYS4W_10775 [Planctomycetota bacterium]
MGRPLTELAAAWGKPDGTVLLEDGRKLVTWTSFVSAGQVLPCRRSFTVSADGVLERFASSYCPPRHGRPIYRTPGGAFPEEVGTGSR